MAVLAIVLLVVVIGGPGKAADLLQRVTGVLDQIPRLASAEPTVSPQPTDGAPGVSPTVADAARASLASLAVTASAPVPPTKYQRERFGARWADTDGNGCNQRDDVLLRDVDKTQPYKVARQGSCDHDVLGGTWKDPYLGESLTFTNLKEQKQAEAIQIDHRVALATAWRDGAWAWTDAQRLDYANDLTVLVAVDGPTNANAKSDKDASRWEPAKPFQCSYAVGIVTVKAKYGLSVHEGERAALNRQLDTCQ